MVIPHLQHPPSKPISLITEKGTSKVPISWYSKFSRFSFVTKKCTGVQEILLPFHG